MKCMICDVEIDDLKSFSNHVKKEHGLNSLDYTVRFLCAGVRPHCKVCDGETRYVSFMFKEYCKEHARDAMRSGGSIGGRSDAWNKGKTKETDDRLKHRSESMLGEKNHFFGKHHSIEAIQRIRETKTLCEDEFNSRLATRSSEFRALTNFADYVSRQQQYLVFCCVNCNTIQQKTLQAFERGSRCYKCHPVCKSNWELDVLKFVKTIKQDAVSGDRSILSPREIDVYVPSCKFGIECHGLYWHSEGSSRGIIDRYSTIKKIDDAREKGIKLIQLFEDEWRDKREVCESLIMHRLNATPTRVYARKCTLRTMSASEQREFFESSHLAGYVPASKAFGLFDEHGVVAAISLRTPRHKKKYGDLLEIARFATRPKTSVPGGLARLLSAVDGKLLTYVDMRIGTGAGYAQCGFSFQGKTGPDYWYTDNTLRYDRFKYRAQNGISEKQIAINAGMSRIWGCGSHVFVRNCQQDVDT